MAREVKLNEQQEALAQHFIKQTALWSKKNASAFNELEKYKNKISEIEKNGEKRKKDYEEKEKKLREDFRKKNEDLEEPKISKKGKAINRLIDGSDFGCQKENVRKLMSLVIDEPLSKNTSQSSEDEYILNKIGSFVEPEEEIDEIEYEISQNIKFPNMEVVGAVIYCDSGDLEYTFDFKMAYIELSEEYFFIDAKKDQYYLYDYGLSPLYMRAATENEIRSFVKSMKGKFFVIN